MHDTAFTLSVVSLSAAILELIRKHFENMGTSVDTERIREIAEPRIIEVVKDTHFHGAEIFPSGGSGTQT